MSQWSRNQTVEVTQEGSPLVQYGRILRVGTRRMTIALLNQDGQALGSFHYDVRDGRETGRDRHFPLRRVRAMGRSFAEPLASADQGALVAP